VVLLATAVTAAASAHYPIGLMVPVSSPTAAVSVALGFVFFYGLAAWARLLVVREKQSQLQLAMALSAGNMTSWRWDLRTSKLAGVSQAERVFGCKLETCDDFWSAVHPDDVARFRREAEAAASSGGELHSLSRIVRADNGQVRWIQTDAHVHRDDAGQALELSGVSQDVTAYQTAIEHEKASQQRLELALNAGKVTAWELDAERRYVWAYNVQLGLHASDIVGKVAGQNSRNPVFLEQLDALYAKGGSTKFTLCAPREGQNFHFLCSLQSEKDDQGNVVRVIGASADITDVTRIQEQLLRDSERKDAFLATLAHELRNPLAPIRYAVALLTQGAEPADVEKAGAVIGRQAEHMARLLDDLLDVSRLTRNVIHLRSEAQDLRDIVDTAVDNVRPAYAASVLGLRVLLPSGPVWVNGDRIRLQQVLGNLLDNAAKYTPSGGNVTVSLQSDGNEAVLNVQDDGIGMPPARVEEAFELFTQLAPLERRSGLGIGLALVRQLVNLHGGSVSAVSAGEGLGTEFVVRLPMADQSFSEKDNPNVVSVLEKHSILVVDDNRDAADTLAMVLRQHGYSVVTAYNGSSALAAYKNARPTIALLDLGLPDINGVDIARAIRADGGASTVLIALTGWGQQADRDKTTDAGFDCHLVKPVEPAELLRVLEEQAARKQPE
jgi:signal transduction histidine kinase/ActR/RegA family two-component response regulator